VPFKEATPKGMLRNEKSESGGIIIQDDDDGGDDNDNDAVDDMIDSKIRIRILKE
jgi:hypothetical protein